MASLMCACRADDQHCPRTALVCIENSHNRCGGCALSIEYMQSLKAWADDLVRLLKLPWLPGQAIGRHAQCLDEALAAMRSGSFRNHCNLC